MTIVDQAKIVIEAKPRQLTAQQIGRLGELLVQYEVLRHGIDSYACCQEPDRPDKVDQALLICRYRLTPRNA